MNQISKGEKAMTADIQKDLQKRLSETIDEIKTISKDLPPEIDLFIKRLIRSMRNWKIISQEDWAVTSEELERHLAILNALQIYYDKTNNYNNKGE